MEKENSKSLSSFVFLPLLSLIFLRPFISGLAYPVFEFYFEILIILIAAVTLILHLRSGQPVHPVGGIGNPAIILLLAYILSTITSVNLHNSFKETLKFISYILIFFCVSRADEGQKKTIIKVMLISASIISIYAIYQYFWGYQHTIDYLRKTGTDILLNSSYARDVLLAKRTIGTFPSPNIFGSYLIMVFFLAIYSLKAGFQEKAGLQKIRNSPFRVIFQLIPAIIIVLALILTKSLGAWLSITACLIILFFISYNNLRNKKIIITASALCIVFILLFIILNRWERLMNLNNPQNSITQRINYWRTAITVIKDHPVLGVGPGNFQEVFLKYKIGFSTNTRYAHNIFLHMWTETGILGFAGILFFIFSLLQKRLGNNKQKFIFLAIIAFILHNLIDNSYFIPETGLLWWAIMGLAF